MNGVWQSYYENGQLSAEETFLKGDLLSYKLYDEKGVKVENKDYKPEVLLEFSGAKQPYRFICLDGALLP
jgi:hypothetical protein